MTHFLTEDEYNAQVKAEMADTRNHAMEHDNNVPYSTRHYECAYLIVRDKDFPDGRVLISYGKYKSFIKGSRHEDLLRHHHYVRKNPMIPFAEFDKRQRAGFTVLKYDDVFEIGTLVFDKQGRRFSDTRVRFGTKAKDQHQSRKDIKLVYAVVKKHQQASTNMVIKLFDAQQLEENQQRFVLYTLADYDTKNVKAAVLEPNQTVADFQKKYGLSSTKIIGMGLAEKKDNQLNAVNTIAAAPYELVVDTMKPDLDGLLATPVMPPLPTLAAQKAY